MAWTSMITEQALTVGERTFGPFTIPTAIAGVHIHNTRVNWPDTGSLVMSVAVDLSLDRGNTWMNNYCTWAAYGGPVPDIVRFGDLPGCSAVRFKFPMTGNNWRRLRVRLNVLYPITSRFEFETF